jgi:hypothetical protein
VLDPWAAPLETFEKYRVKLSEEIEERSLNSLLVTQGHTEFEANSPADLVSSCM